VRVRVAPGLEPRLVRPGRGRETLGEYRRAGGYAAGGLEGAELRVEIAASWLRGRGGAAFPAGTKWAAVASRRGPRVVVANGEEGEPASFKDRHLLRRRPHLVLDGLARAAEGVGARRAIVYVSDRAAAASVRAALAEGPPTRGVRVELVTVAPGYVAGEETAVVRAIDGGPAKPTSKPPRPFEAGVGGRPTLVQNVETLAHVPRVACHGATAFRSVGTEAAPGSFLLSLSGAGIAPCVWEAPLGVPLGRMLEAAGLRVEPRAFLMGGYFGGILAPAATELLLDYESLAAAGSGLGCGAVVVLGPNDCPVGVTAAVAGYFAAQSAQQCGVCVNGTAAMRDGLTRLRDGAPAGDDLERLERWSLILPGRGACALLDGACRLVASLLREFPDDVARHATAACRACAGGDVQGLPGIRRGRRA
jgi:NADH:ubiquinone oxidoreductase subunit F (NADH-binding)